MGDDYTGFDAPEENPSDGESKQPEVTTRSRFGRKTVAVQQEEVKPARKAEVRSRTFRNVSDGSITIGFPTRSVTWFPFMTNTLTAEEIAEPAFQAKLLKFKEIE